RNMILALSYRRGWCTRGVWTECVRTGEPRCVVCFTHFECRLTPIGDPTMVVVWLHDGKPLEAANRLRMVNEFGYCSLDYEAAYARDSGVITCRATNKYGVDQTSATLVVKDEKGLVEETQLPEGRKGAHRIDDMERMAHDGGPYGVTAEEETEKIKPEIVLLPEPARVTEGETARFRCRVTGYPSPKVNWYLNGQLIHTERVRSSQMGGMFSLVIQGVCVADQGVYRCTATNRHGQNSSSAQLTVEGGRQGEPQRPPQERQAGGYGEAGTVASIISESVPPHQPAVLPRCLSS
uniref:Ig-like domain-containing protein n=1 Tax=Mola mola TaxID=94237 RepID=A0A3Q3X8Z2_MOLML